MSDPFQDNPDLVACARIVEKGDPLRFATVMAAPVSARTVLFPIYAFNVEVSRAPWVTAESMIAEMRLQWWRDALAEIRDGGIVRRHEVVTPLAMVLDASAAGLLDGLVTARQWDIYKDSFEDQAGFDAYLTATAGYLMQVSAAALGDHDGTAAAALGWSAGLAAFLMAVPQLEAAGRVPLVDGRPDAIQALAERGLAKLRDARAARRQVPASAGVAFLPGAGAQDILRRASQDPRRVAEGSLAPSEMQLRARRAWVSLTGRW